MYVHAQMYAYMCIYIWMYVLQYMYMYKCMYTCIYIHLCIYICTCFNICTCINVCIYVCIHLYIYTYLYMYAYCVCVCVIVYHLYLCVCACVRALHWHCVCAFCIYLCILMCVCVRECITSTLRMCYVFVHVCVWTSVRPNRQLERHFLGVVCVIFFLFVCAPQWGQTGNWRDSRGPQDSDAWVWRWTWTCRPTPQCWKPPPVFFVKKNQEINKKKNEWTMVCCWMPQCWKPKREKTFNSGGSLPTNKLLSRWRDAKRHMAADDVAATDAMATPCGMQKCQKRPSIRKKETNYTSKRDLVYRPLTQWQSPGLCRGMHQCQKRPTVEAKETYYISKRDLVSWHAADGHHEQTECQKKASVRRNETYYTRKRDLDTWLLISWAEWASKEN